MENQNPQPITPQPTAQPQPGSQIPEPNKKFKFSKRLMVTLIAILFLVLSLYMAFRYGFIGVIDDSAFGDINNSKSNSMVTITPTPDPTADWKTYQNDFGGFSIKLPNSFVMATESSQTVINSVSKKPFTTNIVRLKDPSNISFEVIITQNENFTDNKDFQEFNLDRWENSERKNFTIGSLETFLVTGPNGIGEALWNTTSSIFNERKTYDFTILSSESLGDREELFLEILSTFKFTETTNQLPLTSDPTMNWKTYDGDKFTFGYPSDWIVTTTPDWPFPSIESPNITFHESGRIKTGFSASFQFNNGCVNNALSGPIPTMSYYQSKSLEGTQNGYIIDSGWEARGFTIIPDKNNDICLQIGVQDDNIGKITPFQNEVFNNYQEDFIKMALSFKLK